MPVSNEAWARGMLELALLPSREESPEMEMLRADVYRRDLQPFTTDHQWRHAVSEAVRTLDWFPTANQLRTLAEGAPPPPPPAVRGYLAGGECPMCEGTGFEPFERSGYKWVRNCSAGCAPLREHEKSQRRNRQREVETVGEWRAGQ